MADEPFVDSHIHFWDHSVDGLQWAWLKSGYTFRRWEGSDELDAPRYLPPELRTEAAGTGLTAAVHVHCAHPIADPVIETRWLEAVAEEHGSPEAIVGGCLLGRPDAPDALRRHAVHTRFRGVRDWESPTRLDVDDGRSGDGCRLRAGTLDRASSGARRVRRARRDRGPLAVGDVRPQPRLPAPRTVPGRPRRSGPRR